MTARPGALVVLDAEVDGRPGTAVRVERGAVVAVEPSGTVDRRGARLVDARGAALLPGLHDHHLHLLALASRMASVDLDACATPAAADAALRTAATAAPPSGWVRAGGHDEHRHGPMSRARLDRVCGPVRVRVQHRSGLSWVLSTVGLVAVGLDPDPRSGARPFDPAADPAPGRSGLDCGCGPATPPAIPPTGPSGGTDVAGGAAVERDATGAATGWLHRLDRWLGQQVGVVAPDLAPVGRRLAALGITGVTDATPVLDDGAWAVLRAARSSGALPQHLSVLGRDHAGGLDGWARSGPRKLVADEHVGLDVDALYAAVVAAHRSGRAVAVHCVTRAECVAAVVALRQAGTVRGDRLEHATVLPPAFDAELAAAGVTVVVQPSLVVERGDHHLDAVDPADRPDLHRFASLLAAGVPVGAGSDAPVTSPDPWAAMGAAHRRRTAAGRALNPEESVPPEVALAAFLGPLDAPGGPPRRIGVGAPADLCLLDAPRLDALAHPHADRVRLTVIEGRVVHAADGDGDADGGAR